MDDEIKVEKIPRAEQTPGTKDIKPSSGVKPVEHLALSNYFHIDTPTKEEDEKLKTIWDFGRGLTESGDKLDIIRELMHLEQTLGAPKYWQSRIGRLARYAELKKQHALLEEQLRDV